MTTIAWVIAVVCFAWACWMWRNNAYLEAKLLDFRRKYRTLENKAQADTLSLENELHSYRLAAAKARIEFVEHEELVIPAYVEARRIQR